MKLNIAIASLALALGQPIATAQCFGPGGCGPSAPPAVAAPSALPPDLGGMPIAYERFQIGDETFSRASSRVQGEYTAVAVAGPCASSDTCLGLEAQAARKLTAEAYDINRARRAP